VADPVESAFGWVFAKAGERAGEGAAAVWRANKDDWAAKVLRQYDQQLAELTRRRAAELAQPGQKTFRV
jgi:hypothetical protein